MVRGEDPPPAYWTLNAPLSNRSARVNARGAPTSPTRTLAISMLPRVVCRCRTTCARGSSRSFRWTGHPVRPEALGHRDASQSDRLRVPQELGEPPLTWESQRRSDRRHRGCLRCRDAPTRRPFSRRSLAFARILGGTRWLRHRLARVNRNRAAIQRDRSGWGGEGTVLMETNGRASPLALCEEYVRVRALTERLASVLSPEDQTVQSMPDVSPTKWHRAHVTWFFETFILSEYQDGYTPYDDAYAYIFNSYYETVGARHPRAERGLLSRPGVAKIAQYRAAVDLAMQPVLEDPTQPGLADLITLGLHHEQQHQELLLMDIKHVLSKNPLHPAYLPGAPDPSEVAPPKAGWIEHDGGPVEVGHRGQGFGFDNEYPTHTVHLTPF